MKDSPMKDSPMQTCLLTDDAGSSERLLSRSARLLLPLAVAVSVAGCASMSSNSGSTGDKAIDASAPLATSAAGLAGEEIEADEVADDKDRVGQGPHGRHEGQVNLDQTLAESGSSSGCNGRKDQCPMC